MYTGLTIAQLEAIIRMMKEQEVEKITLVQEQEDGNYKRLIIPCIISDGKSIILRREDSPFVFSNVHSLLNFR